MTQTLLWWLTLELLGLATFPLAFVIFRHLPDRGFTASKALALLLLGYSSWMAGSLGLLPNSRGSILLLLCFLALGCLFLLGHVRAEMTAFLRRQRLLILAAEAVFATAFFLWAIVRAYNPAIDSTEKPMDFAFLNAVLRSDAFPPHDPWLSGHSISYYYFGYLMVAMLTRLTGAAPSVGYNLALALLFALGALGAFGLVYNLVAADPGRGRAALGFGLVGAGFMVGLGNLVGALELAHAHGVGSPAFWQWISVKGLAQPYLSPQWYPTDGWWWWRATRVIDTVVDGESLDYTITEFPFFSFLLGDLHPHVMALPFVLLALALALNLLRLPGPVLNRAEGSVEGRAGAPVRLTPLLHWPLWGLAIVLTVGGLAFLNSWDMPTYLFLFAVVLGFQLARQPDFDGQSLPRLAFAVAVLAGGALLLFLPFYIGMAGRLAGLVMVQASASPDGGVPLAWWGGPASRPLHLFLLWGPFFFLAGSFILAQAGRASPRGRLLLRMAVAAPLVWWGSTEAALAIGGGESSRVLRPWGGHLLALGVSGILLALGWRRAREVQGASPVRESSQTFVTLLIFLSLLLLLIPEFIYVKDVFGTRMNTVFKLSYQTWPLLAIAAAYSLYYLGFLWHPAALPAKAGKGLWGVVFFLFLSGAAVYPLAALVSKTDAFAGPPTLDGLAFVARQNLPEAEAIQWLNKSVPGRPVILEATGDEYSEYGRVASRTGLPTLLGWAGHEVQWRGSDQAFRGRAGDIDRIYESTNKNEVMPLLEKYDITYVYVGHLERAKYPRPGLDAFGQVMTVAFRNAGVVIWERRGG